MLLRQVFDKILGSRMRGVTYIRGVYDFKTYFKRLRPRSADQDIKTQFGLQFQVSEDGRRVNVKSKKSCSLQVPFGAWYQMLPHPNLEENTIPHRDTVPPFGEAKEWSEFCEDIVPTLLPFYKSEYRHSVHIPVEDRDEMVAFLTNGPGPTTPPEWIDWADFAIREPCTDPETALQVNTSMKRKKRPSWRPWLKPKKKFPFRVGTWVAFEFKDGLYAGVIGEVYEEDDLCRVDFADGDKADYDSDEIHYAVQLYKREFEE